MSPVFLLALALASDAVDVRKPLQILIEQPEANAVVTDEGGNIVHVVVEPDDVPLSTFVMYDGAVLGGCENASSYMRKMPSPLRVGHHHIVVAPCGCSPLRRTFEVDTYECTAGTGSELADIVHRAFSVHDVHAAHVHAHAHAPVHE